MYPFVAKSKLPPYCCFNITEWPEGLYTTTFLCTKQPIKCVCLSPDTVTCHRTSFLQHRTRCTVDEYKTNLMSLAILFHFLCAQHVSDINISFIRSLRIFCWIATLVVLFLVRCVLEFRCGWVWVVSVLQAEACNTDTKSHLKILGARNVT